MNITDLKVKVSEEKEKEIATWLCDQITLALEDRADLEARWQKWIKQYEEILPQKKSFPWEGCSNISVPVTPIDVETIHAREVNTLYAVRPYIQIRPKKKLNDFTGQDISRERSSALEKFLDQIFMNVIDLYSNGSQWLLEKNKMGTGFIKVHWDYDRRKVRDGKSWKFVEQDKPRIAVIDIEDLIFPTNARDLQSCSFVAHRNRVDWNYLQRRSKQNIYKNIDKIKAFYAPATIDSDTGTDIKGLKEKMEKMTRTSPQDLKEYEIIECWFDYDIDDDGYAEQVVMTIHKESKTVIRFIYHPYYHGLRPFIDNKYMERVGRVLGKGICEIDEHIQEAINTVFNQAIDNMTIANVKCFKGRKSARKDIGKVYPGKVFWLDDPTDIEEFLLGEVHQSNFLVHNLLRDYSERRTKVTDYTLGRESSLMKSRATATGTLALLQESGRHFDLIINNSRKAHVELAYQIIELYLQYRPDKIFLVAGEEGKSFTEIALPEVGNLREEYEFYCSATSLAVNKEIEKQANIILLQQLGSLFNQMLQLLMVVMSPQQQLPDEIKQFIFSTIKAYYRLAEDVVRSFEKIDIKSYLPELPDIVKQAYGQDQFANFMKQLGGMLEQGGTEAGTQGFTETGGLPVSQPGMGAIEEQGTPNFAGTSPFTTT